MRPMHRKGANQMNSRGCAVILIITSYSPTVLLLFIFPLHTLSVRAAFFQRLFFMGLSLRFFKPGSGQQAPLLPPWEMGSILPYFSELKTQRSPNRGKSLACPWTIYCGNSSYE
jgi:hypothetical protein